ncbi:class I SAM-dependent rRNA methyltransferase [Pararoseomonas indoligenes]|uniref:Class I SAM-dependent rRNA methyltransferase n=1 Tax=Roseomonas indoligenes TaxID=2820811 RepID=A0A940S916_9PROT|nr:class I SAM-dependent rRNA methyltransferase [Pararoseomonas indoligenes]MBP0494773.1 class I SAM-dependent rRNA methyltransferase [Pararoseomonas indoligenes]
MSDLPLLRLLPGRDRRAKAGHPWVFSNEVTMTAEARAIPPGSPVRVEGDDGVRHGIHHFNPHSLIAGRRLSHDPSVPIDDAFWQARIGEALALRTRLFPTPHYRLAHAEADGLPGLILDRYGDLIALQANTAGMEMATPAILRALDALIRPRAVVARNEASVRALEGLPEATLLLRGTEATGTVEEGGVSFAVDPLGGQKTGWFFDQRENRARVANLARGETVLDAFCHTGGFGLQAAAAGAARVTLLDRSEHALATAMETARRNGLEDRVEAVRGEAMETLERMGQSGTRFGVVVADPPAFAKSRKDIPQAVRAYSRLARIAAGLVAPGGILFIASCSHHVPSGEFTDTVLAGLHRARRDARILAITGAGPDHPIHPMLPESVYLKALTIQLS